MATEQIGPAATGIRPRRSRVGSKASSSLWASVARLFDVGQWQRELLFHATPDEINELLNLFFENSVARFTRSGSNPARRRSNPLPARCSTAMSPFRFSAASPCTVTETETPRKHLSRCLTIYVGDDLALLRQLKLPDNAIVRCEVEGADIKGKATNPSRKNLVRAVFTLTIQLRPLTWNTVCPRKSRFGTTSFRRHSACKSYSGRHVQGGFL